MITIEQYQNAFDIITTYRKQCSDAIKEIDSLDEHYEFKQTYINDSELSERVKNCLHCLGLDKHRSKVKELTNISYYDYISARNIGNRSKMEIDNFCKKYNIVMKK
jgi:hypothetical protein